MNFDILQREKQAMMAKKSLDFFERKRGQEYDKITDLPEIHKDGKGQTMNFWSRAGAYN